MKARSFPNMLDAEEEASWRSFVGDKLSGEGNWLDLVQYERMLTEMSADQSISPAHHGVLQQLAEHAADLRTRYHL